MDAHEVLIVGGGPAGSTCAWQLRRAGIDVAILDKSSFPRDKVCGGWITPQVVEALDLDLAEYARGRTLQPIAGFRTGLLGAPQVVTRFPRVVSYGIRRCEFDDYLLRRSGARLYQGEPLAGFERSNGDWIVNGRLRARVLIGAGGHFCPVARRLGTSSSAEAVIAAQEAEFPMSPAQAAACAVSPDTPELYFCPDLKGYGWCFRKGDILNIGLGRLDRHALKDHVSGMLVYLARAGRIGFDLSAPMHGHAYLLYDRSARPRVLDGLLLIGDAAGLAYTQSGEGIRPAVESGLMAADVIAGAAGRYDRQTLSRYESLLAARFGATQSGSAAALGRRLPSLLTQTLARPLMRSRYFARHVVLGQWFLRSHEAALCPAGVGSVLPAAPARQISALR